MRRFPQFARWRRGLLLLSLLLAFLVADAGAGPVPPPPPTAGPGLTAGKTLAESGLAAPEAPAQGNHLGEAQRARLSALLSGESPADRESRQTVRWLGILVQFADQALPEAYGELFDPLNILGYPDSVVVTERHQWFLNVMSQVSDYYRTVSGEHVDLDISLADSVVTLPQSMLYYGDDAMEWVEGVHRLAKEAVAAVDSVVNFSDYDLVTFIHAGAGQESDLLRDSPQQIWSGYVDWASLEETFADSIPPDSLVGIFPGIQTADMDSSFVLKRFSIAPEYEREDGTNPPYVLGALGVYAHQLGGFLGLLSLNDNFDPRAQGAGNFDLMGSGLWNALGFIPGPPSAFNRKLMNWVEPLNVAKQEALDEDPGGGLPLALHSYEQTGDSLLFEFPISDREYFLVENRDQDADASGGFSFDDANGNHVPDNGESLLGAEFDYFTTQASSSDFLPGSGLFFWRIDEELIHLTFLYDVNIIEAYNDHYGIFLLEADGYSDLSHPGFNTESYGSDFDAFRAAGGPNELPLTQTLLDAATLPDTKSAEGADTGWRFHSMGPHGPVMNFTARWNQTEDLESFYMADLEAAGDPLLADIADDPGGELEFVFAATQGADSTFVFALRGLESIAEPDAEIWSPKRQISGREETPLAPRPLIAVSGRPAGSPAAGDLDGDEWAEIVLLMADGRLFAWRGDGSSLAGGDADTPLAVLAGGGASPLLYDLDAAGEGSAEPGLEILAAELLAGSETESDSTRLRWFDADGQEIHPGGTDAESWAKAYRGRPAADPALALEVAPEDRGPDHPAPEAAFFNFCLVDTVGADQGGITRLAAPDSPTWLPPLSQRLLDFTPRGDTHMSLVSADLDADGCDELMLEAEGQVWFWYPRGPLAGGGEAGELIRSDAAGADGVLSLLPADLGGDGALEILALETRRLTGFSAAAAMLSGWSLPVPQTDPPPSYTDPATWALALRDEAGGDTPLLFTRDGRVFAGREALTGAAPILVGGNLAGSPVLGDQDGDGQAEILGLSAFHPVEGNSSPEDSLLAGSRLRIWKLSGDWDAPSARAASAAGAARAAGAAWTQGGANAQRTRRAAAAGPLQISPQGSAQFLEAYPYPNPAADTVTWRVTSDSPDVFTLELYDLEGQRRLSLEGRSDGFSPWQHESRLVGLAPGVYFFSIHSQQSGRLATGRLAVLR